MSSSYPVPVQTLRGLAARSSDASGKIRTFAELLNNASQGSGRVIVLAGEPGVGKTVLLQDFARVGRSAGWQVLLGHAYDSEGMPPYLLFTEA